MCCIRLFQNISSPDIYKYILKIEEMGNNRFQSVFRIKVHHLICHVTHHLKAHKGAITDMFEQFDPIPAKGKWGEREKCIKNLGYYFSVLSQLEVDMTP